MKPWKIESERETVGRETHGLVSKTNGSFLPSFLHLLESKFQGVCNKEDILSRQTCKDKVEAKERKRDKNDRLALYHSVIKRNWNECEDRGKMQLLPSSFSFSNTRFVSVHRERKEFPYDFLSSSQSTSHHMLRSQTRV